MKRRWRCADPDCEAKTWSEESDPVPPRAVLTVRAGEEATRQVGELAMPVAVVARELGVCWWTVMNAVVTHGTPLVEDEQRVGRVRHLGIDETTFLSANPEHRTVYATGLVDLKAKQMIDIVEGNTAADLRQWCRARHPAFCASVRVVATDLAESYRAGTSPFLDHATRVPCAASSATWPGRCSPLSHAQNLGLTAHRSIVQGQSRRSHQLSMNLLINAA